MIFGQSCVQGSERIVSKAVDSKEHDSKIRKEFNNFPMNGTLFYTLVELSPLRTSSSPLVEQWLIVVAAHMG